MIWLFILPLALGLLIGIGNWGCVISTYRTKKHSSTVPLIGGVFLLVGFSGIPTLRPYWWTIPLLDVGTLLGLLGLPFLIRELWRMAPFNVILKLETSRSDPVVSMRFYRCGSVMIEIKRLVRATGLSGFGGHWERHDDGYELTGLPHEKVLRILTAENGFTCRNVGRLGSDDLAFLDQDLKLQKS